MASQARRSTSSTPSLVELQHGLVEARAATVPPADAVSLSVASKRIGGRLKPWASILEALLSGQVEFWLEGEMPTSKSIRVRANALRRFDDVSDDAILSTDVTEAFASQADAGEILNIKPLQIPKIAEPLGLTFVKRGNALAAPLRSMLDVASVVAWDTEVAARLGIGFREVATVLERRGVPRRSVGWCRRHLVEAGVL